MISSKLQYRPSIDGLRALAVIAVFLFHIDHRLMPGGFVGVDIFLVISGYLISSIIYHDLNLQKFSLRNFYGKRLRRIQPALWTVVVSSFVVALILFLPSDLRFFANSVRSVLSFTTNFFFAREVDYFNPVSEEYPLLHIWSLAVEEQFYFLWPLLFIFLFRLKLKFRFHVALIGAIILASFLIPEILLRQGFNQKLIYYMLPSRMGELALGGILGIWHQEKPSWLKHQSHCSSHLLSLLGIVLIFVSLFAFNQRTLFPGLAALVPCLGAVALIGSGPDSWINRILSFRWFVFIGTISYSLYLWHYPVLAFLRYVDQTGVPQFLAAIGITFLLATWSKFKIEDKYKRVSLSFAKSIVSFWLKPAALLLIAVVITYDSRGLPQRYFASVGDIGNDLDQFYKSYCHQQTLASCVIGDKQQKPQTLLIGDSHAGHFMPFWDLVGQAHSFSLHAISGSSCAPVFEIFEKDTDFCRQQKTWFRNHYQEFKVVILGARWESFFTINSDSKNETEETFLKALEQTLSALRQEKIQVIVMAQVPGFQDREYEFALRKKYFFLGLFTGSNEREIRLPFNPKIDQVNAKLRSYFGTHSDISIFDPVSKLQEFRNRLPYRELGMAYKDGNHLNEGGSRELAKAYLVDQKRLVLDLPEDFFRLSGAKARGRFF